MARVESVQLVDDLDGGVADETVSFSLEGSLFEIDLTAAHAAELRDALAPYVGAARRPSTGSAPASPARAAARVPASRQTAEIRRWALANGFELSERGRMPKAVVEAYENRSTTGAPAVEEDAPAVASVEKARNTSGPVDLTGLFKDASAG